MQLTEIHSPKILGSSLLAPSSERYFWPCGDTQMQISRPHCCCATSIPHSMHFWVIHTHVDLPKHIQSPFSQVLCDFQSLKINACSNSSTDRHLRRIAIYSTSNLVQIATAYRQVTRLALDADVASMISPFGAIIMRWR